MRDEAHSAVDRLFDAIERAVEPDLPDDSPEVQKTAQAEARIAARKDARQLWVDLTRSVDQEGVLSEAYRECAKVYAEFEDEAGKRKFPLTIAAQMLVDLGGERGAFKGTVATSLGYVGGSIVDLLSEREVFGTFDKLKRGRGKRPFSISVDHAAWPKFIRLIHYKSRRFGEKVEDTVPSLGLVWSTYKGKRTTLSKQNRRIARDAGAAVRAGRPLTQEQKLVADECEAFLADPEALEGLMNMLHGKFNRPT